MQSKEYTTSVKKVSKNKVVKTGRDEKDKEQKYLRTAQIRPGSIKIIKLLKRLVTMIL